MYEVLSTIVVVITLLIIRSNVKRISRLEWKLSLQEETDKVHLVTIQATTKTLEALNNRMNSIVSSEHVNYVATELLFRRTGGRSDEDMKTLSQAYVDKMTELTNGRS